MGMEAIDQLVWVSALRLHRLSPYDDDVDDNGSDDDDDDDDDYETTPL